MIFLVSFLELYQTVTLVYVISAGWFISRLGLFLYWPLALAGTGFSQTGPGKLIDVFRKRNATR
jgi:hypothetical protein